MSLDGKLYPYFIEETRIKPGFVRTTKGNVTHMSALRQVINLENYLMKNSMFFKNIFCMRKKKFLVEVLA